MRSGAWTVTVLSLAVMASACSDDDSSSPGSTAAPTGAAAVATAPTRPTTPATSDAVSPVTDGDPATSLRSTDPSPVAPAADPVFTMEAYPVPAGSGPHDVSPAIDGGVWFTAQRSGQLGRLDPATGRSEMVDLGDGSSPHGVITGPDGSAWVTDSGRNSIIRVDATGQVVTEHPLPSEAADANLNTPVISDDGVLWFTGQSGWYGSLDPAGTVTVRPAPEGRGPYGITATPSGEVYFASLAGSYVGRIDTATGAVTVLEPPVPDQGSRRVWADSEGRVWVSGWESGDVFVYDPASGQWRSWRLPGDRPMPYAVFVDETDAVWLSDFGANALVRFDPTTETFTTFPLPSADGAVRQLHGRPGEVWGAESAADQLVVVRRSP